jgi:glycosyltransferase involved in cell wall biosynthesis
VDPELSLVIPLLDEEPNIEPLYAELTRVLDPLNVPYEVILVDDGSGDGTLRE